MDLIAPVIGFLGIIGTGLAEGSPAWLAVSRLVVGAAFLGAVTDGMLLGHWYLVQPGMSRGPLLEQVRWVCYLWFPEVALMLVARRDGVGLQRHDRRRLRRPARLVLAGLRGHDHRPRRS